MPIIGNYRLFKVFQGNTITCFHPFVPCSLYLKRKSCRQDVSVLEDGDPTELKTPPFPRLWLSGITLDKLCFFFARRNKQIPGRRLETPMKASHCYAARLSLSGQFIVYLFTSSPIDYNYQQMAFEIVSSILTFRYLSTVIPPFFFEKN